MDVVTDEVRFTCHIEKSEPDQRRFWGKGYIHTTADGEQITDASDDVIDTAETQQELEQAFYGFMKDARSGEAGHELFGAATLIEGVVVTAAKKSAGLFPTEMDEGLYVGFEANDSPDGDVLWDGIKSGEYTALSIVGEGWREAI